MPRRGRGRRSEGGTRIERRASNGAWREESVSQKVAKIMKKISCIRKAGYPCHVVVGAGARWVAYGLGGVRRTELRERNRFHRSSHRSRRKSLEFGRLGVHATSYSGRRSEGGTRIERGASNGAWRGGIGFTEGRKDHEENLLNSDGWASMPRRTRGGARWVPHGSSGVRSSPLCSVGPAPLLVRLTSSFSSFFNHLTTLSRMRSAERWLEAKMAMSNGAWSGESGSQKVAKIDVRISTFLLTFRLPSNAR
jgi:hypothetical protein